jgi:translation initiation factor eIF-2B subunit alpha
VFPLTQEDIPLVDDITRPFQPIGSEGLVEGAQYHNPMLDYTQPAYITLLITDLGVLTPSAVSDELIKLYQ